MKCIECKRFYANKESGLCNACENIELRKINGLLYLPAIGLILAIVRSAQELYSFTIIVIDHFDEMSFVSFDVMAAVAFLIADFLTPLYASLSFFRRKKNTRKVMIIYYLIGMISALYFTVLHVAVDNAHYEKEDVKILVNGLFGVVIWIPYFLLSKRINIVFCR
ncbi:DUF2569 domain-containing protein [Rosenbergiella epipactidis]|uniref:DUF2569 domain-containing protein n=1 Tax=Rosenbergiella epipactidis TaxID=1544694 RepID=UPI001BDAAFAE|nr:DUF2569 domain-containing protein [Rosenbergiella epipactidis]MBT0718260.1 DUF2569 domain-containing protein [Rosenbergiella epipactidis]